MVEVHEISHESDDAYSDEIGNGDAVDIRERRVAHDSKIGMHDPEANHKEYQVYAQCLNECVEDGDSILCTMVERITEHSGSNHHQAVESQDAPIG